MGYDIDQHYDEFDIPTLPRPSMLSIQEEFRSTLPAYTPNPGARDYASLSETVFPSSDPSAPPPAVAPLPYYDTTLDSTMVLDHLPDGGRELERLVINVDFKCHWVRV